jgi:hypothetical protein
MMRQHEELARLRVEEAIQHGLRAQRIQHALRERQDPRPPAGKSAARPRVEHQTGWLLRFGVRTIQILKVTILG